MFSLRLLAVRIGLRCADLQFVLEAGTKARLKLSSSIACAHLK
jgi:hypothetical protein